VIEVFLAGEGTTELGGWAHEKPHRAATPDVGVLEGLLRRVAPSGWAIRDAIVWRSIRKYQAGRHDPETRNVLGAALAAHERGAQVLVFSRDRDGDEERARRVHAGIEEAREVFSGSVVGGVAVEAIEAWTLSVHGVRRAHEHRRPKDVFAERGIPSDHRSQALLIENAVLDDVDAPSLKAWLDAARVALAPGHAEDAPVFLIGFMATGKTTIGGMLAKKLGWSFVDLDQEISKAAGKTIPELFSTEGEPAFRRREAEAVVAVSGRRQTVVATGGGAACRPDNLERMLAFGKVVWLTVSAEEAVRRTRGGKGRPLLEGQVDPVATAAALLAEREPYYSRAHRSVDTTGRSLQDIVQDIMSWLRPIAQPGRPA
jgi:shikimate kinase